MNHPIVDRLKTHIKIVPDAACDVLAQVDCVYRGEKAIAWFPYRLDMTGMVAWDDMDSRLIKVTEDYVGEVVGTLVCKNKSDMNQCLKEISEPSCKSFTYYIGHKLGYSFPDKPIAGGGRIVTVYQGPAVVHDEIVPQEMILHVTNHLRSRFPGATDIRDFDPEQVLENRIGRYNSMDRRLFLQ